MNKAFALIWDNDEDDELWELHQKEKEENDFFPLGEKFQFTLPEVAVDEETREIFEQLRTMNAADKGRVYTAIMEIANPKHEAASA